MCPPHALLPHNLAAGPLDLRLFTLHGTEKVTIYSSVNVASGKHNPLPLPVLQAEVEPSQTSALSLASVDLAAEAL